jgi:hypothetical protein
MNQLGNPPLGVGNVVQGALGIRVDLTNQVLCPLLSAGNAV